MNHEYIYIREDPIYRKNLKVIKLGGTTKPVERDSQYATGEPNRGKFIQLYEIHNMTYREVEKSLHEKFIIYHYSTDGGTEYYRDDICNIMKSTMSECNIEYTEVNYDDIERYVRKSSFKLIESLRDYQLEIKDKSYEYYKYNDKGILNWCCGLGKTKMGCVISSIYIKNYLLIGVFSLGLIEQWIDELKLYYDKPILIIGSKIGNNESTTNDEEIDKWFVNNPTGIIITTYQSSNKLIKHNKVYDFAIFDECHHLTWVKKNRQEQYSNIDILKLNITKQLGLTATIKRLETEQEHIDNMSERYFGKVIDEKSVLWAIEHKYITDYQLLTPKVSKEELEDIILYSMGTGGVTEEDYYLYFSAYLALLSISNYDSKKILIFANNINDIKLIYRYVKIINKKMFKLDLPFIEYTNNNLSEKIRKLNESDKGIFINVYKVGEGINIPTLDTVLISGEMGSSIRITQSVLRPNRLDSNNPKKIAKIIIPLIYEEDGNYMHEDGDLKIKHYPIVMNIIEELSVSDHNIINKIKVMKISKKNPDNPNTNNNPKFIDDIDFENNIKLKIIKRNILGKRTFPYIKKNIKLMGGRNDLSLSLEEDYRNNKQFKKGLPDVEWMRIYIFNSEKTWFDLYDIDTSNYVGWDEFKTRWKGSQESNYNSSYIYPYYSDLEDMYSKRKNYGYTPSNFWQYDIDYEF